MCVKFGHIFHGYPGMEITPYLVFTADGNQILQNKTQNQRMVLSSHWHQKIVTYETTEYDDLTIEKAYEYLKTLPEFEGAEDILEEKHNLS